MNESLSGLLPTDVVRNWDNALNTVCSLFPASTVEQCKQRLLSTLTNTDQIGENAISSAMAALCEQFALEVSRIEDGHIAELQDEMSDEQIYALSNLLYVMDMQLRLDLIAKEVL